MTIDQIFGWSFIILGVGTFIGLPITLIIQELNIRKGK